MQHQTAQTLQRQDERLDKVERNLDVIQHNNKQSQKVINTIKRPIWTAIKGMFTFSKKEVKKDKEEQLVDEGGANSGGGMTEF